MTPPCNKKFDTIPDGFTVPKMSPLLKCRCQDILAKKKEEEEKKKKEEECQQFSMFPFPWPPYPFHPGFPSGAPTNAMAPTDSVSVSVSGSASGPNVLHSPSSAHKPVIPSGCLAGPELEMPVFWF